MSTSIVDKEFVNVGFGPAGIALAVAIHDDLSFNKDHDQVIDPRDSIFFEASRDSKWQPGMILPGTDIQHHFLRDLATPRNPTSEFSFVNYLHSRNRLYPFTLRGGYVTREEWADYCKWVADNVPVPKMHSTRVTEVVPQYEGGRLDTLLVRVESTVNGNEQLFRTRNLVLSTGHRPRIPDEFFPLLSDRCFHSSEFTDRWKALDGKIDSVLVVGGGQNAGEIVLHLANSTDIKIVSLVRNSGMRMYDLGHFANQAYWPDETDYYHSLPFEARNSVYDEQYRTNYAAIDPDVSIGIYNKWYDGEVTGDQRLEMIKRSIIGSVTETGSGYEVLIIDRYTGLKRTIHVDCVILCTGFTEPKLPPLIASLESHLAREPDGRLKVNRDFSVVMDEVTPIKIFMNGISEHQHGIASAASFSLVSIHAGEIAESIRRNLLDHEDSVKNATEGVRA